MPRPKDDDWLDVTGYESLYAVAYCAATDHIEVKSLERTVRRGSQKYIVQERILKPGKSGRVTLSREGIHHTMHVRAIARMSGHPA